MTVCGLSFPVFYCAPSGARFQRVQKWLSSILKGYHFDSVQAFYKEFNTAKRENLNYETACAEYEKTYGANWWIP